MYNPHARPDYADEATLMSKGRLVKARLVDQDLPNVSWFWMQAGNCLSCKYFATDKCLNKKISRADFLNTYLYVNTCPEFEYGVATAHVAADDPIRDVLDVMKAAGIVKGEPEQEVEIIVNEPWSIDLAVRAHREQSYFLHMASDSNSSHLMHEEYDMTDDLERDDAKMSHEDQPRDESGRWKGGGQSISEDKEIVREMKGHTIYKTAGDISKTYGSRFLVRRGNTDIDTFSSLGEAVQYVELVSAPTPGFETAKKKVAILGLAANPPHAGHLALARHVRDTGGFDEVWMMPANKHVFKPDLVEPEHRLAMTRAMLEGEPGISVADTEVKHDLPGPTIDTVEHLGKEFEGTHEFSWVISQDEANSFKHWTRSDDLKGKIPFVVTPRPGVAATPDADWSKEPPHRHLDAQADLLDISSTELRKMLAGDQDTGKFLHPSVAAYIHSHGLYKPKL